MDDDQSRSIPYQVINSQAHHAQAISDCIKRAHGVDVGDVLACCPEPGQVLEQITRHPKGHFVAIAEIGGEEVVLGCAVTMRTNYSPHHKPLSFLDMIGSVEIERHNPQGEWLYGVDFAVLPEYQGNGIGSTLYKARFQYIRRTGLKGMYACGMLKGYDRYRYEYTQQDYGKKVISGEIQDPTVSMQMRNGFEPRKVVESYDVDYLAGNAAVLIVWEARKQRSHKLADGTRQRIRLSL